MRNWINLFEQFDGPAHFDGHLYHATARSNARSCVEDGVRPVSYWGIGVLSEYYVGTVEDDGDEGVVLVAHIDEFDENLLEPDYPGIDEPICYALRKSEDQIHSEWAASGKTWRDSLRIIGSVRYRGEIKPKLDDGFD
jgi:hypothetical protein